MFYIVFSDYSTNKCTGIKPPPVCRYIGNSKTDAISAFKDQIDLVFSTGSLYAGYLHLAGFDESLTFVQTFLNKNITFKELDTDPILAIKNCKSIYNS